EEGGVRGGPGGVPGARGPPARSAPAPPGSPGGAASGPSAGPGKALLGIAAPLALRNRAPGSVCIGAHGDAFAGAGPSAPGSSGAPPEDSEARSGDPGPLAPKAGGSDPGASGAGTKPTGSI